MSIKPSDDQWVDIDSVCAITGWAKGTLYNRIAKGEDAPKAYKFGQVFRFRQSDLDAWLEAHSLVPVATQLAEKQSA